MYFWNIYVFWNIYIIYIIYINIYNPPQMSYLYKIYKKPYFSYIKTIFYFTSCVCQGWKGSWCWWLVPAPVFPSAGLGRVAGCKQWLGHLYLEKTREEAHLQPRDAAGTLGGQGGLLGTEPPSSAPVRWDEPEPPFPGGGGTPSPETRLPHPIFLPLTPSGFGLGEMSAAEKGWPRRPERRAATAPCAGEGTVPTLHPTPFIPAARASPHGFA